MVIDFGQCSAMDRVVKFTPIYTGIVMFDYLYAY